MEKEEVLKVKNLAYLRNAAGQFLLSLGSSGVLSKEHATIIGLSGDLGAGKTAFVKCIAEALGIPETITSPTFILEKIYTIQENPFFGNRFSKLIHVDAYRLSSGKDMRSLDWEQVVSDKSNLVFLEWPEQVESALPEYIIRLSFEYVDEETRSIKGLNL